MSQPAPLQYVGTVSSYQFLLWSSSSAASEPGARMINITADVPSGSPGGEQLNVYLYFVPNGQTLGSPVYAPDQTLFGVMQSSFTLYTAMDDYWAILDLLRNTTGLTFNVDSNDLKGWTLQTTAPQNAGQGLVTGPAASPTAGPAKPPVPWKVPPNFAGRLPSSMIAK
jgi:hypothetical protein